MYPYFTYSQSDCSYFDINKQGRYVITVGEFGSVFATNDAKIAELMFENCVEQSQVVGTKLMGEDVDLTDTFKRLILKKYKGWLHTMTGDYCNDCIPF